MVDDTGITREQFIEKHGDLSAADIRRMWMRLIGCDAGEVESHCKPADCNDADEEFEHYAAVVRMNGIRYSDRTVGDVRGIGLHAERIQNDGDFRELAFVQEWQLEQRRGFDFLDELLKKKCDKEHAVGSWYGTDQYYCRPVGIPTERDSVIAETLIQWLGSNVGMCFVQSALRRVGGDVLWPPRSAPDFKKTSKFKLEACQETNVKT